VRLEFRFDDGAAYHVDLQRALVAHLHCPLLDAGVPPEKVHNVAKSIAQRFSLIGEGEHLRLFSEATASRPYNATEVLLEEYDRGRKGYKQRAAERMGCTPASLRPVIEALREAGQLGGELPKSIRSMIRVGAVLGGGVLDEKGIALVAERLAVFSVPAAVERARAETRRRDAVAEAQRDRPGYIERCGLEPEIVRQFENGQTIEEVVGALCVAFPELTEDMVAKFSAKLHRNR